MFPNLRITGNKNIINITDKTFHYTNSERSTEKIVQPLSLDQG